MFSFFSKENRLIRKYKKHIESTQYNAEQFIRQKFKDISMKEIIVIHKAIKFPNGLFEKIEFAVFKRKTLPRSRKPKEYSDLYWNDLRSAQQYELDLITIEQYRKAKLKPRQFILTGEMKKKSPKKAPSVLLPNAPQELQVLGEKFANKEQVDLMKLLPYLNPDYLDYDAERYVVKCEEISKCQQKRKQKSSILTNKKQSKQQKEPELKKRPQKRPQTRPVRP